MNRDKAIEALREINRKRDELGVYVLTAEELAAYRAGELGWPPDDGVVRILLPDNGRGPAPAPWHRPPPEYRRGTMRDDTNAR